MKLIYSLIGSLDIDSKIVFEKKWIAYKVFIKEGRRPKKLLSGKIRRRKLRSLVVYLLSPCITYFLLAVLIHNIFFTIPFIIYSIWINPWLCASSYFLNLAFEELASLKKIK